MTATWIYIVTIIFVAMVMWIPVSISIRIPIPVPIIIRIMIFNCIPQYNFMMINFSRLNFHDNLHFKENITKDVMLEFINMIQLGEYIQ